MVFSDLADGAARGWDRAQGAVSGALFEPVIRLGVTGLARAGKTIFITSLVANMLERGRMGHVTAVREGRLLSAYLQPQPDDTIPRFDYEGHLARLTAHPPAWPDSTRAISELRLSLRVQPGSFLSGLTGPRVIHIDIVDYPGEWLLDLQLLELGFQDWSARVLAKARARPEGAPFLAALEALDADAPFADADLAPVHAAYLDYLRALQAAGLSDITPGRFLLPGDLAGSPALTFVPMVGGKGRRGSVLAEIRRRFDAYRAQVVKPFFRDHFARLDRQVVLMDVLGAIHAGPAAVEDMRQAMAGILSAFRPGRNSFLGRLLRGRRVDRILFAATKADHLHHKQHPQLTAITQALLAEARQRAEFSGAETRAMAIAALRATVEETRRHDGATLDMVRGTLEDGRNVALYPGRLPDDPAALLGAAREGADRWLDGDFNLMRFAPPQPLMKPGGGPPHIRLDAAAEFLFGDRL